MIDMKKERDLIADLDIDKDDLDKELVQLPQIFYYWCTKKHEYEEHFSQMELDFEVWLNERKADVVASHNLKEEKTSEKAKESYVATDYKDEYTKKSDQISAARRKLKNLESAVESLKVKRDSLVGLGANEREFHNMTGTRIKEKK